MASKAISRFRSTAPIFTNRIPHIVICLLGRSDRRCQPWGHRCGAEEWMEKVQFRSGSAELGALMARPSGAGASPAILLLPAIAGVNEYMQGVARRLADAGYAALLLDYYARTG